METSTPGRSHNDSFAYVLTVTMCGILVFILTWFIQEITIQIGWDLHCENREPQGRELKDTCTDRGRVVRLSTWNRLSGQRGLWGPYQRTYIIHEYLVTHVLPPQTSSGSKFRTGDIQRIFLNWRGCPPRPIRE